MGRLERNSNYIWYKHFKDKDEAMPIAQSANVKSKDENENAENEEQRHREREKGVKKWYNKAWNSI